MGLFLYPNGDELAEAMRASCVKNTTLKKFHFTIFTFTLLRCRDAAIERYRRLYFSEYKRRHAGTSHIAVPDAILFNSDKILRISAACNVLNSANSSDITRPNKRHEHSTL